MPSYVVTAEDRAWFDRCRRAWDLSALARRALAPAGPPTPREQLELAFRSALAVHYFPGMWHWDRSIVAPLVRAAFTRDGGTASDLDLLAAFEAWAPTVDDFTPVRVEPDVDVQVPDPGRPGDDLVAAPGLAVRYRDRIPLVVLDRQDRCWLGWHRIVDDFADAEELALDERGALACWVWEQTELAATVEGVLYTEVRIDPIACRRTAVPRTAVTKAGAATRLGRTALAMLEPDPRVDPTPAWSHCSRCAFRAPCLALNRGDDAGPLLAGYRQRPPDVLEEGRLGGASWGMGRGAAPPHFGRRG